MIKRNPRVSVITGKDEGTVTLNGITYNWAELLDIFSDKMSLSSNQDSKGIKARELVASNIKSVEEEWPWFRAALSFVLKPMIDLESVDGLKPKTYTFKEVLDFLKKLEPTESAIKQYLPRRKKP